MKKANLIIPLGISLLFLLFLKPKGQWTIPLSGKEFESTFIYTENKYNFPRNLLARLAFQESRFRPDIISGEIKSSVGAIGIMQIRPEYHPDINPYDPIASIQYAGKYLNDLFHRFGTIQEALIAYNWGPTNVANLGAENAPLSTLQYTQNILTDIGVIS